MARQRSNFITSHKLFIISITILLLLMVAIAGRLLYERSVVNEMRSIANQLKADPSWTQDYEYHLGPQLICIADEPCPHYVKVWSTPSVIDTAMFNKVLADSNLEKMSTITCITVSKSKNLNICEKEALYKGYMVKVRYSKESAKNTKGTFQIDITR